VTFISTVLQYTKMCVMVFGNTIVHCDSVHCLIVLLGFVLHVALTAIGILSRSWALAYMCAFFLACIDFATVYLLFVHVTNMRQIAPLLPQGHVVYETGPEL